MDKRLAVFDFDGTLISKDSLFEFAAFAVGRRRLLLALLKSLPRIVMWKIGLASNSSAKQKLFSHIYKGLDYDTLAAKGEAFGQEIDRMLNPDVYRRFKSHIAQGDRTLIVSASMPVWIRPWAERQGLPAGNVIGTEPALSADRRITGDFATPNCHGQEKVRRLVEAVPDYADYEIYSYADSSSDRYIMELADHKVWVKK